MKNAVSTLSHTPSEAGTNSIYIKYSSDLQEEFPSVKEALFRLLDGTDDIFSSPTLVYKQGYDGNKVWKKLVQNRDDIENWLNRIEENSKEKSPLINSRRDPHGTRNPTGQIEVMSNRRGLRTGIGSGDNPLQEYMNFDRKVL